jgi:hypothetical protein
MKLKTWHLVTAISSALLFTAGAYAAFKMRRHRESVEL